MSRTTLAIEVVRRLLTASDAVRRRLAEHFQQHDLAEARVNLLRLLASHGDEGSSQVDLATSLAVSESSLCSLIERMRQDGLLFRFRARNDRRRCVVVLSPAGAELLQQIENDYARQVPIWINRLSEQQCRDLLALLDELTASCERIDAEPAASWKEAG